MGGEGGFLGVLPSTYRRFSWRKACIIWISPIASDGDRLMLTATPRSPGAAAKIRAQVVPARQSSAASPRRAGNQLLGSPVPVLYPTERFSHFEQPDNKEYEIRNMKGSGKHLMLMLIQIFNFSSLAGPPCKCIYYCYYSIELCYDSAHLVSACWINKWMND